MATLEFLMDDSTLSEDQANDIHVLHLCASHMQRLVNDVLDLAKLREGSLKIQPEAVRGSERCTQVVLTAGHRRDRSPVHTSRYYHRCRVFVCVCVRVCVCA